MANRGSHGVSIAAIDKDLFDKLRNRFRGELIRPGDSNYESGRKVWNGMINRHPSLIARCLDANDIIAAVNFARENNILASVRGGGHNVAGNAVCNGGLVIDLSHMKSVTVNRADRTAVAEPGVVWGEFDRTTEPFGLATTGGLISTTGIAGFTLGGGLGWLMRKYGLTCDNLLSADVVTADGRLLKASEIENEDLFWGLRGGGGNFGIVSNFKFRLHPINRLVGSLVLHPLDKGRDLLKFFNEFKNEIPDEITPLVAFMTAPSAPFIPENLHGKLVVGMAACYVNQSDAGDRAMKKLREWGPPLVDLTAPMPYIAWQSILDATAPAGFQNFWKSSYLREINDDAMETILSYVRQVPSPMTAVHIQLLGGAVSRVLEDTTAFGHRDAPMVLNIVSLWPDTSDNDKNIQWTRQFDEAMKPHMTGGVYVNFLGDEGEERIKAAYGEEKYNRLAALKRKYDPANFFHLNQNIRPQ